MDILTTILNAYGMEASEVSSVSDMLIQTQNLGKTTVAELSCAMGKVIPTANAYGVELGQLCAGYAIMTANDVATAESTTYMNSMLNELGKSGTKVSGILQEQTGQSFAQLMEGGYSLSDCLAVINTAAADQGLAFGDMSDALGRFAYAADRQLFAVVSADAGCGKSTLIRWFVSSLSKDEYIFLYLSDFKLTPRWFYKGMLDQLGLESKFYRGEAKRQLQKEIEIMQGMQQKKVVCVLDAAHLLEKETI